MKPKRQVISPDLRERILAAWDAREGTQQQIAGRFVVSLGLVKKLVAQRNRLGHADNLYHRVGRKRLIGKEDEKRLQRLVREQPGATIEELHERLGVDCSPITVHRALARMRQKYKKKDAGGSGAEARGRQGRAGRVEGTNAASRRPKARVRR